MQDSGKGVLLVRGQHHMNMIRHDAPRVQIITFPVEVMQRVRNDFCDGVLTQNASSVAGVKKRLHALGMQFMQAALFVVTEFASQMFGRGDNVITLSNP